MIKLDNSTALHTTDLYLIMAVVTERTLNLDPEWRQRWEAHASTFVVHMDYGKTKDEVSSARPSLEPSTVGLGRPEPNIRMIYTDLIDDENGSVAAFAAVFGHELWHCFGVDHDDMPADVHNCDATVYANLWKQLGFDDAHVRRLSPHGSPRYHRVRAHPSPGWNQPCPKCGKMLLWLQENGKPPWYGVERLESIATTGYVDTEGWRFLRADAAIHALMFASHDTTTLRACPKHKDMPE